jgi:hypothetical protein
LSNASSWSCDIARDGPKSACELVTLLKVSRTGSSPRTHSFIAGRSPKRYRRNADILPKLGQPSVPKTERSNQNQWRYSVFQFGIERVLQRIPKGVPDGEINDRSYRFHHADCVDASIRRRT